MLTLLLLQEKTDALQPRIHLNNVSKFRSTSQKPRFHYKHETVRAVEGNRILLLSS
jgi:hypothetical protein